MSWPPRGSAEEMTGRNHGGRIWYAVTVEIESEFADAVGSFLLDRGAPGLEIDERGATVAVTGHFTDPEVTAAVEEYAAAIAGAGQASVRNAVMAETDWEQSWKAHFPPLAIGARVFVHPPWVSAIPAGRVGIELDPGMAFGTGHHGSTQGCLAALDDLVTAAAAQRVLDLGTGSGVLAIAAIKLGAASALAVDIDPLACEIAADNARRNGVGNAIEVAGRLRGNDTGFDIAVVNILSGMLIALSNDIARRLRPGGYAIGSGLESAEAEAVCAAWSAAGMAFDRDYEFDGWRTLVFRSPPVGSTRAET